MLETGSVVQAVVTKVAPFGVYFECDGDPILVVASNLSWRGEDERNWEVGESADIMIVDYNEEKQIYVGSCKATQPDMNPYKHLAEASPSDTFLGVVKIVHPTGLSIHVGECVGSLSFDETTKELAVGEQVRVAVKSVDSDRQFLEFRLAETT